MINVVEHISSVPAVVVAEWELGSRTHTFSPGGNFRRGGGRAEANSQLAESSSGEGMPGLKSQVSLGS